MSRGLWLASTLAGLALGWLALAAPEVPAFLPVGGLWLLAAAAAVVLGEAANARGQAAAGSACLGLGAGLMAAPFLALGLAPEAPGLARTPAASAGTPAWSESWWLARSQRARVLGMPWEGRVRLERFRKHISGEGRFESLATRVGEGGRPTPYAEVVSTKRGGREASPGRQPLMPVLRPWPFAGPWVWARGAGALGRPSVLLQVEAEGRLRRRSVRWALVAAGLLLVGPGLALARGPALAWGLLVALAVGTGAPGAYLPLEQRLERLDAGSGAGPGNPHQY